VARLRPDGVVGPATWAAIAHGVRPTPRTHVGSALEVDVRRQVILVVTEGRLTATLDTSTGSGHVYVLDGHSYIARTPVGRFRITHRIDGWRQSRLGWLWRPAYFHQGYALHGYAEVPAYPASHGCVRLTMVAMDWLWTTGRTAVGTSVWVY